MLAVLWKIGRSHSVTEANDGGLSRADAGSGAERSSRVGHSCVALTGFAHESAVLATEMLPVARVGLWEGRK